MNGLARVLWQLALFCALWSAAPAAAADFYQGKTVRILVGYAPGGGYDTNARVLARHLGRHIPGRPNVIVVNMPGAGSLSSLRYLTNSAAKDGTFLGAFDYAQIGNARMTPDLVRVDFRTFNWIGSIAEDFSVCYVWHTLGVNTLADLKRHGLVHMGRTNPYSAADIEQKMMKRLFKVDLQSVAGYAGSAESQLAVERGELEGGCSSWSSLPADWIAQKKIRPLLRVSAGTAPDFPAGVPGAMDLAANERERQIVRLLTAPGEIGKPYIMALGVPAMQVRIMRAAFDATMKDPLFLADANRLRLPVSPKTAAEAIAIVSAIYAAPESILAEARRIAGE